MFATDSIPTNDCTMFPKAFSVLPHVVFESQYAFDFGIDGWVPLDCPGLAESGRGFRRCEAYDLSQDHLAGKCSPGL